MTLLIVGLVGLPSCSHWRVGQRGLRTRLAFGVSDELTGPSKWSFEHPNDLEFVA